MSLGDHFNGDPKRCPRYLEIFGEHPFEKFLKLQMQREGEGVGDERSGKTEDGECLDEMELLCIMND